jgi:hypothetical protein
MAEPPVDALPPEIEVTETGDGVRYRLPRRDLGSVRILALLPLGCGTLLTLLPAAGLLFALAELLGNNALDGWGAVVLLSIAVPVLLVGVGLCWWGLNIAFGDVVIEIRAGRLGSVARVGFLRWGADRSLENLRRLVLVGIYKKTDGSTEPPAGWATLRADCAKGGALALATGYPLTFLTSLAGDLARRCRAAGSEELPVVTEVRQRRPGSDPDIVLGYVPTGASADPGAPPESWLTVERTDQPRGSRIGVEQDAASVTLTVPPTGLRGGHMALFVIGLVMASGLATTGVLVVVFGMGQIDWGGLLCGFPMALLFEGIGLFLVMSAIDGSRRRAMVAVAGGRLLILTQGPFGTRRKEWSAAELADVRPGPSGTVINGVPVLELQVHPREGEKYGLLAARDVDELEWMATLLRRSLGLPPAANTAAPPESGIR